MEIKIIYQDKNFIAINKPAGLLVHASSYQKTDEPTLIDWLLENFPQVKKVGDPSISSGQVTYERPGIVHRLDRDTSGIMLISLNQEYFSYLKKLFQEKKIKKTYLVIVRGTVKEKKGRIEKPIGIKSGTTKRSVFSEKMAKEAITEYKLVRNFQKNGQEYSLLEVSPLTGRTHQIRVHLASIGHPVIGDKLYGGKTVASLAGRQMLHCLSLELELEPGKSIKLETDLPDDFYKILGEIPANL